MISRRCLLMETALLLVAAHVVAGESPYRNWPDQGMQPLAGQQIRRDEIHPQQAAWINAAYAGVSYRDCGHLRAGCPECVRARATPSNTRHYCGYYVGGGAAIHGEGRYLDEGTFGWDYIGHTFRKRVSLHWWRGKQQGGGGAYATDGPKVIHHE